MFWDTGGHPHIFRGYPRLLHMFAVLPWRTSDNSHTHHRRTGRSHSRWEGRDTENCEVTVIIKYFLYPQLMANYSIRNYALLSAWEGQLYTGQHSMDMIGWTCCDQNVMGAVCLKNERKVKWFTINCENNIRVFHGFTGVTKWSLCNYGESKSLMSNPYEILVCHLLSVD